MRQSGTGIGRLGVLALTAVLATVVLLPSFASGAAITDADELGRFGSAGSGAGQFSFPENSVADPVTGHLYVADPNNNRIDEFTPWGEFVKAFGWDVAPGAVNEQQEVRVRAGAGTFKLGFGVSETGDLPFDATAAEVQSALNALSTIGGAGGSVSIEEALGKPETATPFVYVVVFKGSLAGKDVAQISAENGVTPLSAGNPKTELEVRTRADGTPGGTGLESCTEESGCKAGSKGGGPGQLAGFMRLATDAAGTIYVLEPGNFRVQKFAPDGSFLGAFGGDVVAHGPDDSANDEEQEVTIAASGGSFKLSFEGAQTASLSFSATAAQVEAALDGVASIGGVGGSVKVTGGPGDLTGSDPYLVSFEGSLGGDDLPPLKLDESALSGPAATGYTLECEVEEERNGGRGGREAVNPSEAHFRWLRNGVPIAGATAKTYTVTAADEGKAIQCQGFALGAGSGDTSLGQPARVISPAPAEAAPVPSGPLTLTEEIEVSGDIQRLTGRPHAGGKLECPTADSNGGHWTGATSFSYAWYRNGVAVPGATASTYTVTAADVASPAAFQCVITGANAEGTAVAQQSAIAYTEIPPSPLPPRGVGNLRFADWALMSPPSHVATAHQGGGIEVCSVTAGDVCKAGKQGWVPEEIGGGYGQTYSLALDAAGTAFVGEGAAIKAFETSGAYERTIQPPSGLTIRESAIDPLSGDLYAIFEGRGKVLDKLDPLTGAEVGSLNVERPEDLAIDAAGDVFVKVEAAKNGDEEGDLSGPFGRVIEFGPEGNRLSTLAEVERYLDQFGNKQNYSLSGIGTSALGELYASYTGAPGGNAASFIRFFGPAPISLESPPPRPPQINTQYAASVTASEAELRAKINPHFWNDTTFHLEYGTAPCWEGGCQSTEETRLSAKIAGSPLTSPGVILEGLQAGTIYHYRFAAKSSGGGPVVGPDTTFVTYRGPEEPSCPENETFRTGPSAILPDCRAFEMVSPLDKEGGDIVALASEGALTPSVLNQSSEDGERIAYGSYRSFGGAESAPWTSQYIAARHEGEGWVSHPISPPRSQAIIPIAQQANPEFQAFSPDLCQGWFGTFAEPPLAPEAPAGSDDLYRRTDEECGGPAFEALNRTPIANGGSFRLGLQGISSDGATAIFNANLPVAEGGSAGEGVNSQLYGFRSGEERFLCVLPSGRPFAGECTAGSSPRSTTNGQSDRISNALSANGKLVYWSPIGGTGRVYLRENPMAPQSALKFGGAAGTGTLKEGSKTVTSLIAARGKVSITSGSNVATLNETTVGEFVAGQPLNPVTGIPAGTKVVKVEGATLTLSNAATATNASVTIASKGPAPFAVGQTIVGPGIANGTTITAAKEGELTLSAVASGAASGAALESFSECTEAAKACTLPVSAAAEAEAGETGSQFWAAAEDGSSVLFRAGKARLYEYQVADRSTHLIAGKALGVLGASADASRVYLVSEEARGGENGEGKSAVAGKPNLYFYESGGQFRFVGLLEGRGEFSSIAASPIFQATRVSADGRHAAFMSTASITGYDNTDVATGEADAEVFVYDAGANGGEGGVFCASCNPSGARPVGHEPMLGGRTTKTQAAGRIPGWQNNDLYASRALSEDGRRLFFDSYDALSPRDTNGQQDVYEWEAQGEGSCEESSPAYSPQDGGCVDLISSGKSPREAEFIDASPSGRDAFFTTPSSLVSQDFGLVDIYDAREGGGLPAPPTKPAECEGEACQGTPEAPNDPTPSSESFEGSGNVHEVPVVRRPKPCAKGKVRRHGKCVSRHTKKAHRRAKRKLRAGR
jgi:hypothetical protein